MIKGIQSYIGCEWEISEVRCNASPSMKQRLCKVPVSDNRALSLASQQAQKDGIPLVALFVLSPQDYIAHDRSARRIDFMLRNLALIKVSQEENLDVAHSVLISTSELFSTASHTTSYYKPHAS